MPISNFQTTVYPTIFAATKTLAGLASSATAGWQTGVIQTIDTNNAVNRMPEILDVRFRAKLAAGTPANDKAVYLYAARSLNGTDYESGPPAVGTSSAAYTFASAPGTNPTGLTLVGTLGFVAGGDSVERVFRIFSPPPRLYFVVLNYSGLALSTTESDHVIEYAFRFTVSV